MKLVFSSHEYYGSAENHSYGCLLILHSHCRPSGHERIKSKLREQWNLPFCFKDLFSWFSILNWYQTVVDREHSNWLFPYQNTIQLVSVLFLDDWTNDVLIMYNWTLKSQAEFWNWRFHFTPVIWHKLRKPMLLFAAQGSRLWPNGCVLWLCK